jgi:hypothetical protein
MVSDALKQRTLELIQTGRNIPDAEFTGLVLELNAQQRAASSFLDRYYSSVVPDAIAHWSDLPGMPTTAFKRTSIRAFPEQHTLNWFQTSGTTEGESGRHYFETMDFYEAAILPNFRAHLLPDRKRMPMFILTPTPAELPHSSLVHMMEVVKREFGTADSRYFLPGWQLQFDELCGALRSAQRDGEPVFLLGTAFAFLFFIDALAERNMRFQLPSGSRIMETGGFKGRTREVARPDFYDLLTNATGIPADHIVNEYGMTELSSQFYDESHIAGAPSTRKTIPPWTRVLCIDPATLRPVPDGAPGLIRIYDLANIGSCCVLQTEDVGVKHGDSFEVHGRVPTASPRGCSLAAEDALRST